MSGNGLETLKKSVLPSRSALIITHDYPDPDSLAAAYGLYKLLDHWGVEKIMISYGGFIGRAENRTMTQILGIDALPLPLIYTTDYEKLILVDTLPNRDNVSLPENSTVDFVIDHHKHQPPADAPFNHDIREDAGASAAIVAEYLQMENLEIDPDLATALFYGIKTDTRSLSTKISHNLKKIYQDLFEIIDHKKLSKIENPDLDSNYFQVLHTSIEALITIENLGYAHIGPVSTPDFVAEMADLFSRIKSTEWTICSGFCNSSLYFSIRSKNRGKANKVAGKIGKNLGGHGGGHEYAAAGRIPLENDQRNTLKNDFLTTVKKILNIKISDDKPILRP